MGLFATLRLYENHEEEYFLSSLEYMGMNVVLFHFGMQIGHMEASRLGGMADVPMRGSQAVNNIVALELFDHLLLSGFKCQILFFGL
jgi:hypothetical protein